MTAPTPPKKNISRGFYSPNASVYEGWRLGQGSIFKTVVVTLASLVTVGKRRQILRRTAAARIQAARATRIVSSNRRSNATKIPIGIANRVGVFIVFAKALAVKFTRSDKRVIKNRSAQVVQVSITRAKKQNAFVRIARALSVSIPRARRTPRDYAKKVLVTASSFIKFSFILLNLLFSLARVVNIRHGVDTTHVSSSTSSSNYSMGNLLDLENPTIIEDGVPVDYSEGLDNLGQDTIPF